MTATIADRVTNIVLAGLGGQGVITASDVLADAAFRTGLDVKQSEIHGMSQRGGSVTSDVRFGPRVFSPMVSPGAADFLVVLAPDQVENNRYRLRPDGVLIAPDLVAADAASLKRSLNIALIGALSVWLPAIAEETWRAALEAHLRPTLLELNLRAFAVGRAAAGAAM